MDKKRQWIDILLCAILFLLPFIHVNIGIGIADQGYNLANFELFPNMNQTWMVATLVANIVGKCFTFFPFGHTMLGMNIYCTLLLSTLSVVLYFVLKKDYCRYGVFTGLLIAICFSWAPKVTLYQYLSYYLLSASGVFLVYGLRNNKKKLLFMAGVLLGINLFVRFPNVLQIALIVVVIIHEIVSRKKWKEALIDIAVSILGYVMVVVPVIVAIEISLGKGSYVGMIKSLFAMTDKATAYSPFSMLTAMYSSYKENLKWMLGFIILGMIGVAIYGFLRKKITKMILYAILCIGFVCILRVYWYYGILNMKYTTYQSVYVWGVCFLSLCIITFAISLFSTKIIWGQKLYSIVGLVIIFISPLGSNNALYSNFNNLYLVAPLLVGTLILLWKNYGKENDIPSIRDSKPQIWKFSWKPYVAVGMMLTAMVAIQTFLFHAFFVFGDEGISGTPKSSVASNEILVGMKTSESNAEILEELTVYIEDNYSKNDQFIVWGHSPLLFYVLDIECAIGHIWPGLDSYSITEFKDDMENMTDYPIVIYEVQYYGNLLLEAPEQEEKTMLITNLLQEGDYVEVFRNDFYVICVSR